MREIGVDLPYLFLHCGGFSIVASLARPEGGGGGGGMQTKWSWTYVRENGVDSPCLFLYCGFSMFRTTPDNPISRECCRTLQ